MQRAGWGSTVPLNSPTQSLSKQLALSSSDKTAWLQAFLSKPLVLTLPDKLSSFFPSEGGRQYSSHDRGIAAIQLHSNFHASGALQPWHRGPGSCAPRAGAECVVHTEVSRALMERLPWEVNGA